MSPPPNRDAPPSAQTCPACNAPCKPQARFCGACGGRLPEPDEDPQAIQRYRTVLASFAEGSGLKARELQQLEALRQRLGLSLNTHERLLAEFEAAAPAPVTLGLAIDVATMRHFEVATRCMVRLRLNNTGDLALETLAIHPRVVGAEALETVTVATLFPELAQVAPMWLVPDVAGFHELSGVLHAVDLMGEHSFYAFDGVQFRVGAAGAGPSVSVVHIDQRSARVVDNSRSDFGASQAGTNVGLVTDAEWHDVPLRPLSVARAAQIVPALAALLPKEPPGTRAPAPTEDSAPGPAPVDENRAHPAASSPSAPVAAPGRADGRIDFEVATESARYHVTSTLAEGDLATVFGGRRRQDGALVAVKIADEAVDNDLMQAEIRALSSLRADDGPQLKHLPVIVDRFRTRDGRLGTIFELLDGYDLLTIREKLPGGIPARHVMWILRRCLSILGWAHSRGILHGNLDPAHIMVRPHDHNVWLVDWCYAIINPAQTGQGFRCLNEIYSPPEVSERKPPLPSSDLYSLGKCMIYALGGDPVAKSLPEALDIDERFVRFLKFFVRESPLGRARDAWDLYTQLDRLRKDIYGRHKFIEFKI